MEELTLGALGGVPSNNQEQVTADVFGRDRTNFTVKEFRFTAASTCEYALYLNNVLVFQGVLDPGVQSIPIEPRRLGVKTTFRLTMWPYRPTYFFEDPASSPSYDGWGIGPWQQFAEYDYRPAWEIVGDYDVPSWTYAPAAGFPQLVAPILSRRERVPAYQATGVSGHGEDVEVTVGQVWPR